MCTYIVDVYGKESGNVECSGIEGVARGRVASTVYAMYIRVFGPLDFYGSTEALLSVRPWRRKFIAWHVHSRIEAWFKSQVTFRASCHRGATHNTKKNQGHNHMN